MFKSSGTIYRSLLPFSLSGELSTDKYDSDGFFSIRKVYMVSYRSKNMTGLSVHRQRSTPACYKLLIWHCTCDCWTLRNRVQCAFLWLLWQALIYPAGRRGQRVLIYHKVNITCSDRCYYLKGFDQKDTDAMNLCFSQVDSVTTECREDKIDCSVFASRGFCTIVLHN